MNSSPIAYLYDRNRIYHGILEDAAETTQISLGHNWKSCLALIRSRKPSVNDHRSSEILKDNNVLREFEMYTM